MGLYQFLSVATNGRISPLKTEAGEVNPLLIEDENLSSLSAQITAYATASGNPLLQAYAAQLGQLYGKARHAAANDLVLLTTSGVIGTENSASVAPFNINGITFPLQDNHVLTSSEAEMVATATTAYNNSIKAIAQAKGLAVADMNAILAQLADNTTGLKTEDGQIYYANYFSTDRLHTTLFSLDGIHPNAKGYAIVANEIIKVINQHYNAYLPLLNASQYPGATILTSNN